MTSRHGPDDQRRVLRCSILETRFSERKGTPLFDSRLPPGKAESVLEHVAEGCGVVARAINTSFVESQNGTDRHRNARKALETYRISKDWRHHEAVTYLTIYVYHFCWPVRTSRIKDEKGRWRKRSPAMAAGLAEHVWSTHEWLASPSVRR